jgi:tRNA pseudouridine13 synthase
MYIHAYQSYVWNAVVSERTRRFGYDRPIPGDLVLEKNPTAEQVDMDVDEQEMLQVNEEAQTQAAGAVLDVLLKTNE